MCVVVRGFLEDLQPDYDFNFKADPFLDTKLSSQIHFRVIYLCSSIDILHVKYQCISRMLKILTTRKCWEETSKFTQTTLLPLSVVLEVFTSVEMIGFVYDCKHWITIMFLTIRFWYCLFESLTFSLTFLFA